MSNIGRLILVLGTLAMPAAALAGGYGVAGVRDATVGQSVAAGQTVWCPRLNSEIPFELQEQMDCGGAPAAGRNRPGFFANFRHVPEGSSPNVRDGNRDPVPNQVTQRPPSPGDDGPRPTGDTIGKWDRLGELNVTPDNYSQQGQDFIDDVRDFSTRNGSGGDWTEFRN